jgi:hypothetical protein
MSLIGLWRRVAETFLRAAKQVPWDQGSAHPSLVDLLETKSAKLGLPSSGRAFVPGCGTVGTHRLSSFGRSIILGPMLDLCSWSVIGI